MKNEKLEKILKIKDEIKQESSESSPDLIIDESPAEMSTKVHHLSSDITIELINSVPSSKSPEKIEQRSYFDDDSPPGTPSTPKTPEMISQSPPLNRVEKRKRKDKSKIKKVCSDCALYNIHICAAFLNFISLMFVLHFSCKNKPVQLGLM